MILTIKNLGEPTKLIICCFCAYNWSEHKHTYHYQTSFHFTYRCIFV